MYNTRLKLPSLCLRSYPVATGALITLACITPVTAFGQSKDSTKDSTAAGAVVDEAPPADDCAKGSVPMLMPGGGKMKICGSLGAALGGLGGAIRVGGDNLFQMGTSKVVPNGDASVDTTGGRRSHTLESDSTEADSAASKGSKGTRTEAQRSVEQKQP